MRRVLLDRSLTAFNAVNRNMSYKMALSLTLDHSTPPLSPSTPLPDPLSFLSLSLSSSLPRPTSSSLRVSLPPCLPRFLKMDLILDVNVQLYPMELGDKFRLVLATSLREDGYPDDVYNPDPGPSRADRFESVSQ